MNEVPASDDDAPLQPDDELEPSDIAALEVLENKDVPESLLDALHEPPDPLADTSPVPVPVPVELEGVPLWRRALGVALLLLGAVIMVMAGLILFLPLLDQEAPAASLPPTDRPIPTAIVPTATPEEAAAVVVPPPTLSPDQAIALLSAPPADLTGSGGPISRQNNPFTIIPDRPRGEVITYTVQEGDTISSIAERFGLEMDTIAWSNDRDKVFALRPGSELYILPVDGVYHRVLVPQTIQEIADEYNVDPYDIINSEFNDLFGATPETVLQSGTRVVVPGGTSSSNDWQYTPLVERSSGSSGGGGSDNGSYISFARGEPGSCGVQPNPGGTGYFAPPISAYTWVRGFTGYHTGVDLAAPEGTPVYASSPGRVIYRGWNNWGYGYLIVLAHGPFTSLYGHLSRIYVSCGQMVGYGDLIGAVGNTGNSSGPHLHFELRYNDIPVNPTLYVGF